MKLLTFERDFSNEVSCKDHFRRQRETKGITCKNVAVTDIIGYDTSVNGNVNNVHSEQHCEVKQ